MTGLQLVTEAVRRGVRFTHWDPEDGKPVLFRWHTGDEADPILECCMAFNTLEEAARDALAELAYQEKA